MGHVMDSPAPSTPAELASESFNESPLSARKCKEARARARHGRLSQVYLGELLRASALALSGSTRSAASRLRRAAAPRRLRHTESGIISLSLSRGHFGFRAGQVT